MENFNEFETPTIDAVAKIVVIGVGGAGNNAVNRMIDENIESVSFYVANTDKQALNTSKVSPENRLVLGERITNGLGAGGDPAVGKAAAENSEPEIREIVKGANLVFIAAGMGGGTGTGAAPVVARIAREEGALTVAIVTRPFTFEGKKRGQYSIQGLNDLKANVDSIIIVSNDKLLMSNGTAPISEAFSEADRVLTQSVRTVTDLILKPASINLDFADVRNTLKDSGIALIGFGIGTGQNKTQEAAQNAISSPLLEASIEGARRAICEVTCGKGVSLYEAIETVEEIVKATGSDLDIKFGVIINDQLDDQILVSVIASDFNEEVDFTAIPKLATPSFARETITAVKPTIKVEETAPKNENKIDDSTGFLPGFLSGKNFDD